jgi:hypothetical protein
MSPTLAIIGGTGDLGSGLAIRLLSAGYTVNIGSRSLEKAVQIVEQLNTAIGQSVNAIPATNLDAAAAADIVILTVPYSFHDDMLQTLKPALDGKIFVDTTVPLVPPKVARVQLPEAGSAGLKAQQTLGDNTQVVSAFQNVAAHKLASGEPLEGDVLVCGNKKSARQAVVELAQAIGLNAYHAGAINNAAAAEAMTSLLIFINKNYGGHAGIQIVGTDRSTLDEQN